MRISRIHVDSDLALNTSIVLDADASHYIGKVLRLSAGTELSLFNSRDGEFLGKLTDVSKKSVSVALTEQIPCKADPVLPVHIGIGLSRGERMDFIIQKATELGVSKITPLFTERCEIKLKDERAEKRQLHWQRVAISACEQCQRCQVPEISLPVSLQDWLQQDHVGTGFVLDHRSAEGFSNALTPTAVTLLSGPEGGLTESEIDAAIAAEFNAVKMGPRVLRTETAPIAALALVQMLWGDFS